MEVFAGSLSLSGSESALVGMLQTDNNKRKTPDWAEEGREGVALEASFSLVLRGERVVHGIPGDFANRSTRDNERRRRRRRNVSCIVTDFYTIYIYETKFRETVFRDLIE